MGLDRDELAARVLCALLPSFAKTGTVNYDDTAKAALFVADALLAALAKSAPVAPAPYVPKVGDVVSIGPGAYEVVYTGLDNDRHEIRGFVLVDYATRGERRATTWDSGFVKLAYLRPATPAERIAAGIDPAPASEAKRPTHIRVLSDTYGLFTVGKVYAVIDWDEEVAGPRVLNDEGKRTVLVESKWEPCPPPAPTPDPVAAAERAVIEAAEKWHDRGDGLGYLLGDAVCALRAARAAKGGGA